MSLLSVYADAQHYLIPSFDRDQCRSIFGDNIANQFDVNFEAKSYSGSWSPLNIDYVKSSEKKAGDLYPDISEHNGRLILNIRAYNALKELIANDGEFLPAVINGAEGFIFNPLRVAEKVNGLNEKLSIKNEWGDIENTAFHEDIVSDFTLFRAAFDNFRSVYCQPNFMNKVEQEYLKGLFFTPDIGNPYSLRVAKHMQNG